METKLLLKKLGKMFPKKIAKANHDFVGLMMGTLPKEVRSVLLCLDFDEFVMDEIEANGYTPDLIITHHPFIYGRKKDIFFFDPQKESLSKKIVDKNLTIYSMHTNFDGGSGGMNDTLAKMLNLGNVRRLPDDYILRIGDLPREMTLIELARYAKKNLNLKNVRVVQGNDDLIKTIGIIGGGGSSYYKKAMHNGAQAFISGDAPHWMRRDVLRYKMNYIDVAHEVERVFMGRMKEILSSLDSNIKITIIDHEEEVETI